MGDGDTHVGSVDVIQVRAAVSAGSGLSLRWSEDAVWAAVRLPQVRTAMYTVVARSVLVFGGIREGGDAEDRLVALNVDRRTVTAVRISEPVSGTRPPPPRGGGLFISVSPLRVLLLSGSNNFHDDAAEMLTPHVLEVLLD